MDSPSFPDPARVERRARCCCGHLSLRVRGEPVINGLCHCADCRRRTGSAFGWSAYFPEGSVKIAGKPATYLPEAGTGDRHFCPDCGTTLFWRSSGFPELIGIAGGAFVETPLPEPNASYRDGKSCAWLTLPGEWQRKG